MCTCKGDLETFLPIPLVVLNIIRVMKDSDDNFFGVYMQHFCTLTSIVLFPSCSGHEGLRAITVKCAFAVK